MYAVMVASGGRVLKEKRGCFGKSNSYIIADKHTVDDLVQ